MPVNYRAYAWILAKQLPDNFVGVLLRLDPYQGPKWESFGFPREGGLEEWYSEIAPSPSLYYYIAAFDKSRGTAPVGESVAPLKPDQPGYDAKAADRWRHSPYKKMVVGADMAPRPRESHWGVPLAIIGTALGIAYVSTSRALKRHS